MPNHFHLLIESKRFPLSVIMQRLLTGYVKGFNFRHRRIGHLFQGRYKAILWLTRSMPSPSELQLGHTVLIVL